jgi:endoglucanase Acf2
MHKIYFFAVAVILFLFFFLFFTASASFSQVVNVGNGSYSNSLPPGAIGPSYSNGSPAVPKVTDSFSEHPQTNDFWSSLIFPFFGNPHSNVLLAHPANFRATGSGLEMGYTPDHQMIGNDYVYPYSDQLLIGVQGLNAQETLTDGYGDWTVTAKWDDGTREMAATIGHGLPFAFFTISGGDAQITTKNAPNIWYNQNGVIGLTVSGRHYGIFAPDGSEWSGTSVLRSDLDGKDYLSVALLPDNSSETLEFFRKRAYAHVTDSRVSWEYDENSAVVNTTFAYEVELKEDLNDNLGETLSALYRHQWLYTTNELTSFTYTSRSGEMKLHAGNSFSTSVVFDGIVPTMPDLGTYNRPQLISMVESVAQETIGSGPTYENGKEMGRFARLVHIADQLNMTEERDYFLSEIKSRLEQWFTVGGQQEYVYNDEWSVMTGYPSGFGADNQINDHHFHHGYAIMSAATIAQYDPEWAAQDAWGGMVNLLIRDANSWDREDALFPFLRGFDAYAGHSWAAGHGDFADGNNQESSSESMHFSSAVMLWGTMTDQPEIRDLGIFLHANERTAIEQYWFDVDNEVFPESYPHVALGIVWGGKGAHTTWFGGDPEFIHGINFLPITGGSMYLGRHPEYVQENYDEIVQENGGPPDIWQDVLWNFLAFADPERALSELLSNPNYPVFDGESRAHTYHWIGNLNRMGQVDTTITASVPTYAAFRNENGEKSYVAFNALNESADIIFSDGFTLNVEARSMGWFTEAEADDDTPVALLNANAFSGKAPMTVLFSGSSSYDPNGLELDYAWDFGDGNTSTEVNPEHTYTEPGTYQAVLTVTNTEGLSDTAEAEINVFESGTPFQGEAPVIPARIEAENYDEGGQNVAYSDMEENNIGQAYRPEEGVDIISGGSNGFNVYWMVDSEWLEYTIEVPEDGLYDITPYLTTVPGFGDFRILVNNVDISGTVSVPATGSWDSWTPFPIEAVSLSAGTKILRFEVSSETDTEGWLYSLDYIDISESNATSTNPDPVPGSFELEASYPNPFNPTSRIAYSIPEDMPVLLEVYSVSGQHVATLVDGERSAGRHITEFDGQSFASGVYIYRLKTPKGSLSGKMTLLK